MQRVKPSAHAPLQIKFAMEHTVICTETAATPKTVPPCPVLI